MHILSKLSVTLSVLLLLLQRCSGDVISDIARLSAIPPLWNPGLANGDLRQYIQSSCGVSWTSNVTFTVTTDGSGCAGAPGAFVVLRVPNTPLFNLSALFTAGMTQSTLDADFGVSTENGIPAASYLPPQSFYDTARNFSTTARFMMRGGGMQRQNFASTYSNDNWFYYWGQPQTLTMNREGRGMFMSSEQVMSFGACDFTATANLSVYFRFKNAAGAVVRVSFAQSRYIVPPASVGQAKGGPIPNTYIQASSVRALDWVGMPEQAPGNGRINNLRAGSLNFGSAALVPDVDYLQTALLRRTVITDVILQPSQYSLSASAYNTITDASKMAFYYNFTLHASTSFTPTDLLAQFTTVNQTHQAFTKVGAYPAFAPSDFAGYMTTYETNWAPLRRFTLPTPVMATALRFTPSAEYVVDVNTMSPPQIRGSIGPLVRLDYMGIDQAMAGEPYSLGLWNRSVIPDAYIQASDCTFCPFMLRPANARLSVSDAYSTSGFVGGPLSTLQIVLPQRAAVHAIRVAMDGVVHATLDQFRVFYSTTLTPAHVQPGDVYAASNDAHFQLLAETTGDDRQFVPEYREFANDWSISSTSGTFVSLGVPLNATAIRIQAMRCDAYCFFRVDLIGRYTETDFAPPNWMLPTTPAPTTPVPTTAVASTAVASTARATTLRATVAVPIDISTVTSGVDCEFTLQVFDTALPRWNGATSDYRLLLLNGIARELSVRASRLNNLTVSTQRTLSSGSATVMLQRLHLMAAVGQSDLYVRFTILPADDSGILAIRFATLVNSPTPSFQSMCTSLGAFLDANGEAKIVPNAAATAPPPTTAAASAAPQVTVVQQTTTTSKSLAEEVLFWLLIALAVMVPIAVILLCIAKFCMNLRVKNGSIYFEVNKT
jgi:hypothetical protein